MAKFLKILKYTLFSALGLIFLIVIIAIYSEQIAYGYKKLSFSHISEVSGISA